MPPTVQNIPDYLVYELYNGKSIHYKAYQQVLNGSQQLGDIIGRSYTQSLIISNFFFLLKQHLSTEFVTLTSEIGLVLDKNSRRAADIAIFKKDQLEGIKDRNKYLTIPPKYVIEVDIKASNTDIEDATSYYHKKTDDLLNFGVESVIWVFTDSQKVMIANKGSEAWKIIPWDRSFFDIEQIEVRVKDLTV